MVTAIASQVHGWSAGDTVAALLAGGGDAEQVCVPASELHPLPGSMDLIDAAPLPEAAATAWVSLLGTGGLPAKWASIIGTTLRSRPAAEKAAIVADVIRNVWRLLEAGTVRPLIHARVPLAEAERAHEMLRTGEAFGTVLLIP